LERPNFDLTSLVARTGKPLPKQSICIVTPDLLGPVRNGGIGTANTFLAYELAEAGYHVFILFSQCGTTAKKSDTWLSDYHQRRIVVEVAQEWGANRNHITSFPNHPSLVMAHIVYDWLSEHSFDAVLFMEWQGHGFYALQAKRCGLRFKQTALITQLHSPSLWHMSNNADVSTDPMQALTYFMERKSVELADAVISPSAYMLDWVRNHGYNLPALSFVQPNLLGIQRPTETTHQSLTAINELVFFGRLEYRKGLIQFCDALDRLVKLSISPGSVTFLGKFSRIGQEHSALYITRRACKWGFPIKILPRYGQSEALAYLSVPGRLAIMPSVADNSPYTVYECLVTKIPFLARDVGGVSELIAVEDQSACLFNDNPNDLAQRLCQVLTQGAKLPRLAFSLTENRQAWRNGLHDLVQQINQVNQVNLKNNFKLPSSSYLPLVSVCLTHYNRPKLLRQAVTSLIAQDYARLEVILVDDGSTSKEAVRVLHALEPVFLNRGWKILRLENGYLGRARNTAVRASSGKYVLFMDDDNVAKTNMVSCFVRAAIASDADLVTAVFDVFAGDKKPTEKTKVVERFLPVGDVVSFSVVTNAIGDANSLMRRSLFDRLGGFSEDYGLGHEDFELYLRAVLSGAKVSVIPEPLFWYRRNGESMLSGTHALANQVRSFRPFLEQLPAPLAELAVLAFGLAFEQLPKPQVDFMALEDLLLEDRQRLLYGDPDASDTIVAASHALRLMDHVAIADALLEDLVHPMTSGQMGLNSGGVLEAAVILATQLGDVKQLRNLFTGLGKSLAAKNMIASACYLALATSNNQVVNADVIKFLVLKLIQVIPESLNARLSAAKYLFIADYPLLGMENIAAALELADENYLSLRPDVKLAITTTQQFSCGLEHYYNHGCKEGVTWPEWQKFIALWPQYVKCIELDNLSKINIKIKYALVAFRPK
jgi:glycosyltransferase involved in cell wall biosynthesis